MAVIKKFIIHQVDVKTTFLIGDFTEEIYIERPEGLDAPIDIVCKLTRSLCELNQASRLWHEKFDRIARGNGYRAVNLTSSSTLRLLKER